MATKTNPGNFFEDFKPDAVLTHAIPRTLTEGDQSLYIGLTGDRYPLHCSAEFARGLGYERETINDLLAFHIVFGKTVNDVSLNAVANLGYADVRFHGPVYPGDTLRASSRVIGKKENRNGKTGIVWVHSVGTNQRGEAVLEWYRWVMVQKRDPSSPAAADTRPDMPKEVAASDLTVPKCLDLTGWSGWETGGSACFDDYEVGEKIDHVDGMTIEESEHAIATRLYQNTSKVHFDAHAMKDSRFGRRLMYGGHVISTARSLSFSGLENSLGILAWNSGAHAAPTFAGDTVYAYTEVLDKADISGRADVGALRLRLVALKNASVKEAGFALKEEKDGKSVYDPRVVLDLDHWQLMPKRPPTGA